MTQRVRRVCAKLKFFNFAFTPVTGHIRGRSHWALQLEQAPEMTSLRQQQNCHGVGLFTLYPLMPCIDC